MWLLKPYGLFAKNYLICPIGVVLVHQARTPVSLGLIGQTFSLNAGQELAPAFAKVANRLLWRHRAFPSATLDKMRTKL
jgi:hypothetical protein